jgi:cytochrome P450
MIRWDAPLQLFERWVLADDVIIADQHVRKGEKVALLFGAANRDPRHFPYPDTFDAGRNDPSHITFGGGIHFCIGAPLARLELEVAMARLLAHCPHISLIEQPRRQGTFVIRGLESLRVAVGAA